MNIKSINFYVDHKKYTLSKRNLVPGNILDLKTVIRDPEDPEWNQRVTVASYTVTNVNVTARLICHKIENLEDIKDIKEYEKMITYLIEG